MTVRRLMAIMTGVVALTLTLNAQVQPAAEVRLQRAIKMSLVDGDLRGAVDQFKALAQDANPRVAAEALVHLGRAYDTLGSPETRATFEQVARRFPGQTQWAAEANAWLAANPAGPSQAERSEQLWTDGTIPWAGGVPLDGGYLPFEDWSAGPPNLAVRDLRSGQVRRLTSNATVDGHVSNPVVSSDGTRIAYIWANGNRWTLRIVAADGSQMRDVIRDAEIYTLHAWSPDGRYLVALKSDMGDRTSQIILISTTDGSTVQLESIGTRSAGIAGFSRDGRHLVYTLDRDAATGAPGGVYALAVDGRAKTALVEGPVEFRDPHMTPDRDRVVFVSEQGGAPALWSIEVADGRAVGTPVVVKPIAGNWRPLGFTRDGAFYYSTSESETDVYTADLDPESLTVTNVSRLTNFAVSVRRDPELSPDGRHIAFLNRRAAGPTGLHVVVRSLATGEERSLTTLAGRQYTARPLQWFPDGRSLLIHESTDTQRGQIRFRQLDVESGDSRLLFEHSWDQFGGAAALSPDGTTLFYTLREPDPGAEMTTLRLMKRRLESGVEEQLHRTRANGTGLFQLAASPDGSSLAFLVDEPVADGARTVMVIPSAGGPARTVFRARFYEFGPLSSFGWTRDGRHLVATCGTRPVDRSQLCAIPAAGGPPRPLGVEMDNIPSRMVSSDGRRIAFTGVSSQQELWVTYNMMPSRAAGR